MKAELFILREAHGAIHGLNLYFILLVANNQSLGSIAPFHKSCVWNHLGLGILGDPKIAKFLRINRFFSLFVAPSDEVSDWARFLLADALLIFVVHCLFHQITFLFEALGLNPDAVVKICRQS